MTVINCRGFLFDTETGKYINLPLDKFKVGTRVKWLSGSSKTVEYGVIKSTSYYYPTAVIRKSNGLLVGVHFNNLLLEWDDLR